MFNHIKKDKVATTRQTKQLKLLIEEFDNNDTMWLEHRSFLFYNKAKYIMGCIDTHFDFRDNELENKYYDLKFRYDKNRCNKDAPPYKSYSELTS